VSKDFDAHFVKLVTSSLLRSADDDVRRAADARFASGLRTSLAVRRSSDRRRVLQLLEQDPSEVVGYLRTQSRARRTRSLLAGLAFAALLAAASLLAAVVAKGAGGIWVSISDAALVLVAIVGCFAYASLVSAESTARRRLQRIEGARDQERRTGADRRRMAGVAPDGVERRSGIDRRTIAARGWADVP
jgi:uncharacterized membrane protein (UPF0136 family)